MKKYEFVRVFESGEEEPIPADDLEKAIEAVKNQHGLILERYVSHENRQLPTDKGAIRIEAEGVMAIVLQIANMEKYRGMRIDAIEVGSSH